MTSSSKHSSARPYTLVAELTYRCLLRCAYCSNPLDYLSYPDRLATHDWVRVFREAEQLGVLQVNLSGGEPLLRGDLPALVQGASQANLYVNLITSGIPGDNARLTQLRDAGLNSVQVSIQDSELSRSDKVAGRASFDQKIQFAKWVKDLGLPLTMNVVLHRDNLEHLGSIIELAETLSADRLELANAQYLAWALVNRERLLPSREQLEGARKVAAQAKRRLRGKMEVLFVLPDYYSDLPKACMSGWGNRYIVVRPDGVAMPCHLAHTIRELEFANVLDGTLGDIWRDSHGFQAFRGHDWLPEPCRSCARHTEDFGGCRCQAYHLTGDARATDPACHLAPGHGKIVAAREAARGPIAAGNLIYRSATRNA